MTKPILFIVNATTKFMTNIMRNQIHVTNVKWTRTVRLESTTKRYKADKFFNSKLFVQYP